MASIKRNDLLGKDASMIDWKHRKNLVKDLLLLNVIFCK